jgi:hypothetical protein
MTATELTGEAVAARIAPYFQAPLADGMRFTVGAAREISLSRGYWRVPVHPEVWPERVYRAAEELAYVQEAIEDREGLKVILILAEPIDEVRE